MEKLQNFLKRTSKKEEKTFPVAEGGFKTQSELYQEYQDLESETQCMISFEGWCQLRKSYRR